jgi:CheY-like chemotaxis protein
VTPNSQSAAAAPGTPASDLDPVTDAARKQLLTKVAEGLPELRYVAAEFTQDPAAASRSGNLAEFYRRTHHLVGAATASQCHNVALMAGALEALLSELVEKPQFINPSTARTVAASMDFLGKLIADALIGRRIGGVAGEVLVVDDDPLSNCIATAAMGRARLKARALENPLDALNLLSQHRFELIVLDIEMPQLSGFELCRRLRLLPGYEKTPVIYLTAHTDFDSRARSILSGGNDLIAKPIFPIELAVNAVSHLIRGRMAGSGSPAA